MSKSSELLRERAVQCAVDEASGYARMMGALADLLDACVTEGEGYYRCEICGSQASSGS